MSFVAFFFGRRRFFLQISPFLPSLPFPCFFSP
uniref:Uncharacterized protein n=1 Tax=Rhizophora mucronata TaxID=61149 RepID=A0A2P2INF6_RHIMU